jgi:ABC-type Fe3+/spermidine/putrescine transport system ATPase subunit
MSSVERARAADVETHSVPRLELRKLTKAIAGNTIVDGIDLKVEPGECVVLLGPSGCGKTSTLRMVAGFVRPDSGEIHLNGQLASGAGVMVPTERRQLGMVFQNYAVWPHKTVADNIVYGLVVAGLPKAQIRVRLQQLLENVRLAGLADRYPSELSGGQQQRVALARAIATEPSLLLLDEPLSNLDAALRQEMRHELKEIHARTGTTMLYVTHDQEEALVLADRVMVMNRGQVEQAGTPAEIYGQPRSRFVASFVGTTNLFPGRVEAKDPATHRLRIRTDCGFVLWARTGPQAFADLNEGHAAAVCVRPEDVTIEPAEPGSDAVLVRLKTAAFLGNRYDLHLEVAGGPCRADVRSLAAFTDGVAAMRIHESSAWVVP